MTEADELAERKADLLDALGKLLPGEPSPPAGPPALVRCSECRGLVRPGAVLCVTDWPEERPQVAVTGQWAHLHQPALGLMTRPLCPHSTPPPSSPASTGSGPN